mgnify:CR=1 FL=1
MMRRSALKPTRLPRLARMAEDALTPLIGQLLGLKMDRLRVSSRRRPRFDLRLSIKEGDLFVTDGLTGLTVRATSPGPRARLVAQVAPGLAAYNGWCADLVRRAREHALTTAAAPPASPGDAP